MISACRVINEMISKGWGEVDGSWLCVGQVFTATVRSGRTQGQAYGAPTLRGAAKCCFQVHSTKLNRGFLALGELESYVHTNVSYI